ncbi:hypothetical protein PybrP1_004308 [[Pythium] brassicae (nom. inval.)]|nr:hypothetical protein PybrP1_004308 [[Pythium] brassicae (nom. inval.)]
MASAMAHATTVATASSTGSTAFTNSTRSGRQAFFATADGMFMRASTLTGNSAAASTSTSAAAAAAAAVTASQQQQRRLSLARAMARKPSYERKRPRKLPLFVSTFNMGEQNVRASELASWIPLGYQVYVIGVQECMDLADLQAKIHHHLVVGSQCKFVHYSREIGKRATALGYHGYIALTVFVRESAVLDGRFQMPLRQSANKSAQEVYRGKSLLVFGRAANKGAVGMALRFEHTSFAFVTCHLASDSSAAARLSKRNRSRDGAGATPLAPPSKLERRNQDAMQILQQLYLDDEDFGFGFPLLHHHSFILGDFNYRMTRRGASPHEMLDLFARVGAAMASTIDVVPLPSSPPSVHSSDETDSPTNSYGFQQCLTPKIERAATVAALVGEHDELRTLLDSKQLFYGFEEPAITFFPTFRRVRGERLDSDSARSFERNYTLTTSKGGYRVPSYTDRVLHSALPGSENSVECIAYSSCEAVTTSDHKPVFGLFQVTLNEPPPPVEIANAGEESVWTNSGGGNLNILSSATATNAARMKDVPGACEMQLKIDFRSVHWMDAIDSQPGSTLFDRAEDIEFGFLFPIPCEDVFSQQRKLHEVAEQLTWLDSGGGGGGGGTSAEFAATVTPTSNFHTVKWNKFVEGGLRYNTMAKPSSKKHVAVLIRAQSRARGLSRTASGTAAALGGGAAPAGTVPPTAAGVGAGASPSPREVGSTRALKASGGQILGQGTFCVATSGRKSDTSISLTVGGKLLGRLQLQVALQGVREAAMRR